MRSPDPIFRRFVSKFGSFLIVAKYGASSFSCDIALSVIMIEPFFVREIMAFR